MRVTVEQVDGRAAFKRFLELPFMLYREEPRWAPPLIAHERARLDPARNPFFVDGDGIYLLARTAGRPSGRLTAHIAHEGDEDGWFGFYDVIDDAATAAALVEQAAEWLRARGCVRMTGPASFTLDDEAGVLVVGDEVAGTTGRPWHPLWYAAHLRTAGLHDVTDPERRTWRLPTVEADGAPVAGAGDTGAAAASDLPDKPALVGPYADERLLLRLGAGTAVAVPDLSIARAAPLRLGKRARRGDWEGCTVVACDGDPAVLVPAVQRAAGSAGYRWVVAPWSPDPATPPETVHRLFTADL